MVKVAFHTLGCKVNIYETEGMSEVMKQAGYQIVDWNDNANIYIVNTCSVTNMADRKSRQMLHRAKKENPSAIIVAAGCYVQSAKEKIKEDNQIDIIVGNNMKQDIVSIIDDYIKENPIKIISQHSDVDSEIIDIIKENINKQAKSYVIDINRTKEYEELLVSEMAEHTRAFIKIQDGCNQFCTYCIIPYTRGRVRSRQYEDIIKEVQKRVEMGYKEVVLTGIHLSSYGVDFDKDYTLIDLIEDISKEKGIERIRIGSLEPRIITDDFLTRLAKIESFCPHFHLSLQSGCDDTLKRMNRCYSAKEYSDGVHLIRKYFELPAITTDLIVGFPNEDENEFEISKKFVEDMRFFEMHIFPYSKREGTKAAKMSDTLTQKEKSKRSSIISKISQKSSDEFRKAHLGKYEEILLEEKIVVDEKEYMLGHTKSYVKVAIDYKENMRNHIVYGKIDKFIDQDILYMKESIEYRC